MNPHPTRDPRGHSYGQAEACESWTSEQWHENESYLYGIDLYHYGYLWESHEEWEGLWRSVARGTVAALFLQALILNSAAQIKARAGSVRGTRTRSQGAARRLEEALALCDGTGTRRFMGIDIQDLIEQIERHYGPTWEPDVARVRTEGPPPRLIPGS